MFRFLFFDEGADKFLVLPVESTECQSKVNQVDRLLDVVLDLYPRLAKHEVIVITVVVL